MNRLLLLLLLAGGLAAGAAAEQLVPWRQQRLNDAAGMRWDVGHQGEINSGQNNAVSNANMLTIDGSNPSFNSRQMTADGRTQVFTAALPGMELVRRVRLDPASGVMRWVEILRSTDGRSHNVNLQVFCQFPYGLNLVTGDSGQALSGQLGAKDTAMSVAPQHPQLPSVVIAPAHPRARLRPTVLIDQNSQSISSAWQVTLPAKGAVAIVHVMMQRPGAVDAAALRNLCKLWQDGAFLADLPPDVRRAVANWSTGGSGPAGAPRAIPEDLLPAAGEPEVLTLAGESRLRGTSTAERVAVTTPRGRVEVPYARVAAIGGGGGGQASVFLRDGQVLAGRVEGTLRFTLLSGLATAISPDRLAWLVRCRLDQESPRLLINASDGLVFAVDPGERVLPLATCWGRLDLPLAEVRSLGALESGALAVQLRDGSRILGQLAAPLELASEWFGLVRLAPTEVRAIGRLEKPREDDAGEPAGTSLRATGDQILVGEIALDRLRVMTPAGEVPLLAGQIRRFACREDAAGAVAVELWGGDTLGGQLLHRRLPLRLHGLTVQVPVDDVIELVVPVPAIPPETRERISVLIRDLGDAQWERREEASKALGVLGALAKPALEAAVAAGDPEVRSRAEALLQAIK